MKHKLILSILNSLEAKLSLANDTYQNSLKLSQSGDLKSDGKYDTRAIEAGYLTSAQKARCADLTNELNLVKAMKEHQSKIIMVGSLIEIKHPSKITTYFVTPRTGGLKIKQGQFTIQIISTLSPLWDDVEGLEANDEFEVEGSEISSIIIKVI